LNFNFSDTIYGAHARKTKIVLEIHGKNYTEMTTSLGAVAFAPDVIYQQVENETYKVFVQDEAFFDQKFVNTLQHVQTELAF